MLRVDMHDRVVGSGDFLNPPLNAPPEGHFYLKFTQYVLPRGDKRAVYTAVPDEHIDKAREIINNGFDFEIEMLTTGHVSMTIVDPQQGYDAAIRVCENGPAIADNIIGMIRDFNINSALQTRKELTDDE